MNNMWKLSVNGLREIVQDSEYPCSWEPVVCKGTIPSNISHHKSAVFGNSVVIFGGINDYENNKEVFEFDSTKCVWSKLK